MLMDAVVPVESQQSDSIFDVVRPDDDTVSLAEFVSMLVLKMGNNPGLWKAWKLNAVRASEDTISDRDISMWIRGGRVPRWAVERIASMVFDHPVSERQVHVWTITEHMYLIELCKVGEYSDLQLSQLCSEKFAAVINVNMVKGHLHRLRKAGEVGYR